MLQWWYTQVLTKAGVLLLDTGLYYMLELPEVNLLKDFFDFGIFLFVSLQKPCPHLSPCPLKINNRLMTDSSAKIFYDPANYSLIWLRLAEFRNGARSVNGFV